MFLRIRKVMGAIGMMLMLQGGMGWQFVLKTRMIRTEQVTQHVLRAGLIQFIILDEK